MIDKNNPVSFKDLNIGDKFVFIHSKDNPKYLKNLELTTSLCFKLNEYQYRLLGISILGGTIAGTTYGIKKVNIKVYRYYNN